MNILSNIKSREDLLAVPSEQLSVLCREIREFLIDSVSKTGGHLASNLGAVELTVALHRVYDPMKDRILFDVGHQSYIHKILTGRGDRFDTLRKIDGLSGFPKPSESPADPFLAGHASDSVSLAVGMARARTLQKKNYDVVAVIGDGALTGGLSYEGLSDAGDSGEPMVIVLNDNGMSINSSVGGVAHLLSQTRIRPSYIGFKRQYRKIKKYLPNFYRVTHNIKENIRNRLIPSGMFGDMGLYYIGPVDGHNIKELELVLRWAREMNEPVLVHVVTVKGKGVDYAENEPEKFHGVGPFDPITGETPRGAPDFSSCFGERILQLGKKDPRVCAVTAAMESGTGLTKFSKAFPDRFFELGIAEGHAAAMCGGMAKQGMIPVFAVYSTFLQRAYDMLIVDNGLMNLHTVLAVDRCGLVGKDGVTHHGNFDAAFLDSVPGARVYAPASFKELEDMLDIAVEKDTGLSAVRYPRGGEGLFYKESHGGEATTCLLSGRDVTIVSYGILINEVLDACNMLKHSGIEPEVIKLNRITPIEASPVIESLRKTGRLVLAEEVCRSGSPGTRVLASVAEAGIALKAVRRLDLGSGIVCHGSVSDLRKRIGLDAEGIRNAVMEVVCEKAEIGSAGI